MNTKGFYHPYPSSTIFFILLTFLNFYQSYSACAAQSQGCSTCYNSSSCLVCMNGFRLLSNLTCQACIGGCAKCYFINNSCNEQMMGIGSNALPCTVPNCSTCPTQNNICQACIDSFQLTDPSSCRQCKHSNAKTCSNWAFTTSCGDGYLLQPNKKCSSCQINNCKTCSAIGICTQCLPRFGLFGGQCQACTDIACKKCSGTINNCEQCQIRFGVQSTIQICVSCADPLCVNCSLDSIFCEGCEWKPQLTTINGLCLPCSSSKCIYCLFNDNCTECVQSYGLSNGTCLGCLDPNCVSCGLDYTKCNLCITNYAVITGDICMQCIMSSSFCLTCDSHNINYCLSCPIDRTLDNTTNTCILCPNYCTSCQYNPSILQVQCKSCISSFYLSQVNMSSPFLCSTICGDLLILGDQECDNQIGRLYDGCTDQCKVQDNFTCFSVIKSICSYNNTVYIDFESISQSQQQNKFTLKVKIWPPLYIFTVIDQDNLKLLFNLSPNNLIVDKISFNNQFNILQFEGKVTQNISEGEKIIVNFIPSQMTDVLEFSRTPDQVQIIQLNRPLIFYKDELKLIYLYLCFILTIFAWISFIVGVVARKLPGIEAIFVFQMAYITLVCSNFPLIEIFVETYPLKYTTGYNHQLINEDKSLSKKLTDSPYLEQYKLNELYLLNNFNIGFIVEICLFLILAVMYCRLRRYIKNIQLNGMNKKTKMYRQVQKNKKNEELQNLEKLVDWYQFAWQLIMNVVLWNLTYFVACCCFFFKFGIGNHFPSLLIFCLQIIVTIITLIKFFFDPSIFDYFRSSFQISKLAMNHYFLHVLNILVSVILLTCFSQSYIPLIPVTIMLIYTIAYRPYKEIADNIRSIFNMTVVISFLMFRVYAEFICKCTQEQQFIKLNSQSTKLFYLINLILLLVVAVVAIIMSVCQSYRDYKLQKHEKKQQLQLQQKIQLDRRSVLYHLTRIDPNQRMQIQQTNNVFKKIIDPNKSLLNATKQSQKVGLSNIRMELSNQRFLTGRRKKKSQDKIKFNQNTLCQEQDQKCQQENKAGVKQTIQILAGDILKDEKIYINFEASMRRVHDDMKVMQTQNDILAYEEYDKIDADYHHKCQNVKKVQRMKQQL